MSNGEIKRSWLPGTTPFDAPLGGAEAPDSLCINGEVWQQTRDLWDRIRTLARTFHETTAAEVEAKTAPLRRKVAALEEALVGTERRAAESEAQRKAMQEKLTQALAEANRLRDGNKLLAQQASDLVKLIGGATVDERQPRAETWLKERANWEAEVQQLREHARQQFDRGVVVALDKAADLASNKSWWQPGRALAEKIRGLAP